MIALIGKWTQEARATVMSAVIAADNILAEIVGLAQGDTTEAFDRLFGDIVLEAVDDVPGPYYGYVSNLDPRHIKLQIGHIDFALVGHELGHVVILTDPEEENIADKLSHTVIRTERGRAVTGQGAGNKYARNMGYYGTRYTGYASIIYPDHQHPVYFYDGNTPTEDFCDMFLSLLSGNIANNEAGRALRKWIIEYLRGRLG